MILREQLAQKAYNSSIINIAEEQLAKINKMLEIDADEKMKKCMIPCILTERN